MAATWPVRVAAKAAFDTQRKEADKLCGEYQKLFSDAEDQRLFTGANTARQEFLVAADKVIEMSGGQKPAEAVTLALALREAVSVGSEAAVLGVGLSVGAAEAVKDRAEGSAESV